MFREKKITVEETFINGKVEEKCELLERCIILKTQLGFPPFLV